MFPSLLPHLGLNTFLFPFPLCHSSDRKLWSSECIHKREKRAKAKHRRLFKVDDQEAPSDGISADEGHCRGVDNLTAAHLSLREKMPLSGPGPGLVKHGSWHKLSC